MTLHVLHHRAGGLHRLLQPLARDAELFCPVTELVILINVDPLLVLLAGFPQIVSHGITSSGKMRFRSNQHATQRLVVYSARSGHTRCSSCLVARILTAVAPDTEERVR